MVRYRGQIFGVLVGLLAALSSGCGRIGFDLLSSEVASGGRPAEAGLTDGSTGGSSTDATPTCVLACENGICQDGACRCDSGWIGDLCDEPSPLGDGKDGAVTFDTLTDLSEVSTGSRTCADGGDAVQYSVVALTGDTATLASSPASGCLTPGDAVLLSNRQGAPGASASVGNYEFLVVGDVTGNTVRFTTNKIGAYGEPADDGLGVVAGTQRVILQRVPQYSDVTVANTGRLTARAWDGTVGGVLALRIAGSLRLDGTITMDGKGFQGGPATTSDGAAGRSGESVEGVGTTSGVNVGGGAGGLGDSGGAGCLGYGLPGAGGGHAAPGGSPTSPSCDPSLSAAGGQSYGDPLGSVFHFGSGGGAGGASRTPAENPPGGEGGTGGGVIIAFAGQAVGTGILSAMGLPGQGDTSGNECSGTSTTDCWDASGPGGGGAGGTVILRSPTVSVGTLRVTGAPGGNGLNAQTGDGGRGANGYPIVSGLP